MYVCYNQGWERWEAVENKPVACSWFFYLPGIDHFSSAGKAEELVIILNNNIDVIQTAKKEIKDYEEDRLFLLKLLEIMKKEIEELKGKELK
jgi:hypothetical protein